MADVTKEKDLWVHSFRMPPDSNNSIKMEVGIEDCLHIEFEYNKSKYVLPQTPTPYRGSRAHRYHLKDVIVGKIYFLLVRIKIKHMELSIIRRETTGSPPNQYNESETITKFEIMDGAPVRGETIPIRLFLGGFDLTPTFRDVNKRFSVRYYLNLVLIDEENRRYFKQQEITVFRIPEVRVFFSWTALCSTDSRCRSELSNDIVYHAVCNLFTELFTRTIFNIAMQRCEINKCVNRTQKQPTKKGYPCPKTRLLRKSHLILPDT